MHVLSALLSAILSAVMPLPSGDRASVRVEAAHGRFEVRARTGTVESTLPGPDEPEDLFILSPTAAFTAQARGRTGPVLVVLYDSSQIGPMHGTDRRALVYAAGRTGFVRVAPLEALLEGTAGERRARERLSRGR